MINRLLNNIRFDLIQFSFFRMIFGGTYYYRTTEPSIPLYFWSDIPPCVAWDRILVQETWLKGKRVFYKTAG